MLMAMHIVSLVVIHTLPSFHGDRPAGPLVIALLLMLTGIWVLWRSLRPFRQLRERLGAVRAGKDLHLAGSYPTEVQPLVDDLNALLRDRERAVQRAIATAGDLAHGLKTPLALLNQEAERASAAGERERAEVVAQQVERMTRQINYHLARARAAASGVSGNARCNVGESASALIRTLSKLYADRALSITTDLSSELQARVQREDLDEMLGNLLDNAYKWAKTEIHLHVVQAGSSLLFVVDDDGPGLTPDQRSLVLERGVRLDEASPGSGLGLAIVRDLAELYGGSIELDASPLGGLRGRLSLQSQC